jgi:predicted glycosyltransferase involved in capsule biosynthesis
LGHLFLICDIDTKREQINKIKETIVKSITIEQMRNINTIDKFPVIYINNDN